MTFRVCWRRSQETANPFLSTIVNNITKGEKTDNNHSATNGRKSRKTSFSFLLDFRQTSEKHLKQHRTRFWPFSRRKCLKSNPYWKSKHYKLTFWTGNEALTSWLGKNDWFCTFLHTFRHGFSVKTTWDKIKHDVSRWQSQRAVLRDAACRVAKSDTFGAFFCHFL